MKLLPTWLPLLCCFLTAPEAKPADSAPQAATEPPVEWIEPATGHRVIRLSREPGTSSFYFHQNASTASGDKLVVSNRQGLATINLQTRQIEPLVEGRAGQVDPFDGRLRR